MLRVTEAKAVVNSACVLGEGPVWNPALKALFWTDIKRGEIWRYCALAGRAEVILSLDMTVGGLAFTEDNAMILCSNKGVYKLDVGETAPHLLLSIPLRPGEVFNDITTDPRGRILAGTLRHGTRDGRLCCLEAGKAPRVLLTDLGCSNGMTFSMDGQWFYHTDSSERRISRYRYDAETGNISNPGVFFQGTPEQGLPDGLTIDVQDSLWSAFWSASCVRRLDRCGNVIAQVPLPVKQPTSVVFGGNGLSELFITSAAMGGGSENGGPVFRVETNTRGRAEWPACF